MKTHTPSSLAIAVLGLLGGTVVASAQISLGADAPVRAVGESASSVGLQEVAAGARPDVALSGRSSGAAAGGVSSPLLASARAKIDGIESIEMGQARLAQNRAEVRGASATKSAVVPLPADDAASAALNVGFSAQTIRDAKPNERELLFTQINNRIDTSSRAIDGLKRDSKSLHGDARARFKAAAKEVAAREKELKASVKTAGKASADNWAEKRAELAARYDAYAAAVAKAESLTADASAQAATTAGAAVNTHGRAASGTNADERR